MGSHPDKCLEVLKTTLYKLKKMLDLHNASQALLLVVLTPYLSKDYISKLWKV